MIDPKHELPVTRLRSTRALRSASVNGISKKFANPTDVTVTTSTA